MQTFQASPVTLGGYFTRVAPHHQEILSVFATEAYPLTHPGKTFCQTNGYLREYIHAVKDVLGSGVPSHPVYKVSH